MGSCIRYQWLEVLIRIANTKYCEPGKVKSPSEALQMMIEKDIQGQAYEKLQMWQFFRDKEIWTLETDAILKNNIDNFRALVKYHLATKGVAKQVVLYMRNCTEIFSDALRGIDFLTEKEAKFCYGMSKMTNVMETDARDKKLHREIVCLAEFLEFFVRVADCKYKNEAGMTLVEKIICVMQFAFPLCSPPLKPNLPKSTDEESQSESDDDY